MSEAAKARSSTRGIALRADPYRFEEAERLASWAGLSYPVAAVLARRGHGAPGDARSFLEAAEEHDPDEFRGMDEAVGAVLEAIEARRQITVYGDFDADGVCATAILVAAIRGLGGSCDWFIPDRIADGYGLNSEAIRALAGRGTELVVTVDCGVTAVEEVALARELGMGVVVTDHHQPGPGLPNCPVIHPELSGYPFTQLCGAAVAAKLASRLRRDAGRPSEEDERDLDLVAVATVADVMPLTGENRRLVREGLKVARRARRPGMAALLEECRIAPQQLDAEDFGFRLAPRINAAGRMYRADAGVELFLTETIERAEDIARELSAANAERRRVEREVTQEAERVLAEIGGPGPAIVLASEGWHPGVVGIVASRLVKAHGRPTVVVSLEGGTGRGSARSVPGLDIHAAIGEAEEHLLGYGGHAAAAGLRIETNRLDAFRDALGRAVIDRIGSDPVEPDIEFDAVAGGEDLGLGLAEELEQLAPFGNANPPVSLLIPGAKITDLREMGEGKHCRFSIVSGVNRATGVCFGRTDFGLSEGERADVIAELDLNHWNGTVEPRLVVREVLPLGETEPLPGCEAEEWWARFELAVRSSGGSSARPSAPPASATEPTRKTVEWTDLPGVRIGELISSGEPVAILAVDACSRWRALGGATGLGRFNPEAEVVGLWEGSPAQAVESAADATVVLTDYTTLFGRTGSPPDGVRGLESILDRFPHVIVLDPPASAEELAAVRTGRGWVHRVGGLDELEYAMRVAEHRADPTPELRELYRTIRECGAIDDGPPIDSEKLRTVLAGKPLRPRSPERAALLVRILDETGLLRTAGVGAARSLGVVSSVRIDLTESPVFTAHIERHKELVSFLRRSNSTASSQTD